MTRRIKCRAVETESFYRSSELGPGDRNQSGKSGEGEVSEKMKRYGMRHIFCTVMKYQRYL